MTDRRSEFFAERARARSRAMNWRFGYYLQCPLWTRRHAMEPHGSLAGSARRATDAYCSKLLPHPFGVPLWVWRLTWGKGDHYDPMPTHRRGAHHWQSRSPMHHRIVMGIDRP